MKPRIKHTKVPRVRTTITIEEPLYAASAPKAAKHPSFSAYVQSLVQRDVEQLVKEGKIPAKEATV